MIGFKFHIGAMACAARNRVKYRAAVPCTATTPPPVRPATVPLSAFLPTKTTEEMLEERMLLVIKRALIHHLPYFKGWGDVVPAHIEHAFSPEMALKSEDLTGADELVSTEVLCCSNSTCPHGSVFHAECVGIGAESLSGTEDDWYCSEVCRRTIETSA